MDGFVTLMEGFVSTLMDGFVTLMGGFCYLNAGSRAPLWFLDLELLFLNLIF